LVLLSSPEAASCSYWSTLSMQPLIV